MLETDIAHQVIAQNSAAPGVGYGAPANLEAKRRAARTDRRTFVVALIVVDALALLAAFVTAYWLRFEMEITIAPEVPATPHVYLPLALALLPTSILIFAAFRLYDMRMLLVGLDEYGRVLNACTLTTMVVICWTFAVRAAPPLSRAWLVMFWVFAILFVCIARFLVRRFAHRLRSRGRFVEPALIVGANAEARALSAQLADSRNSGLVLRGLLAADDMTEQSARVQGLAPLGTIDALGAAIAQQGITEVVVASSALNEEQLLRVMQEVARFPGVRLRLSSGLYEVLTTGMHVTTVASVPLMTINRLRLSGGETILKTALDYTVILLLTPLLIPLFLVIALVIKLDSRGPIFHRRPVIGVGGREFDAFKFRTMVTNGNEILNERPDLQALLQRDHKLRDDPRITRVGHVLRRYSLDELPQLINVLRGEMSLVGPRMVHASEVAKYGRMRDNLFTVKPGLTGMWQVSGRSDLTYEERVQLDMLYIRDYSIWLDLQILLIQTPPAVLRGHGAY